MSPRRQRSIPLGGCYRQVSLYNWQLFVITHELIYSVQAAYHYGKNYCETGLFEYGSHFVQKPVCSGSVAQHGFQTWCQYCDEISLLVLFVCSTFFPVYAIIVITIFIEFGIRLKFRLMTSSNGNIFRVTGSLCVEVTGEFPSQRPVTRSFDVFFDLCLE